MGVTANACVLLGYIIARLPAEGVYRAGSVEPEHGRALIENVRNGNTYALMAVQLTGAE